MVLPFPSSLVLKVGPGTDAGNLETGSRQPKCWVAIQLPGQ